MARDFGDGVTQFYREKNGDLLIIAVPDDDSERAGLRMQAKDVPGLILWLQVNYPNGEVG